MHGVEEVVVVQSQTLYRGQRVNRPAQFGKGDGAVQRGDRSRRDTQELVIQLQDLRPAPVSAAVAAALWTALIAAWS